MNNFKDMDHYPPLPDLLLDSIPKISWGFQVCEIIAIILFALWFMILFFHKHRLVKYSIKFLKFFKFFKIILLNYFDYFLILFHRFSIFL